MVGQAVRHGRSPRGSGPRPRRAWLRRWADRNDALAFLASAGQGVFDEHGAQALALERLGDFGVDEDPLCVPVAELGEIRPARRRPGSGSGCRLVQRWVCHLRLGSDSRRSGRAAPAGVAGAPGEPSMRPNGRRLAFRCSRKNTISSRNCGHELPEDHARGGAAMSIEAGVWRWKACSWWCASGRATDSRTPRRPCADQRSLALRQRAPDRHRPRATERHLPCGQDLDPAGAGRAARAGEFDGTVSVLLM